MIEIMTKCAIIIPSRLASIRLPNKPLANIANKPMIIWVVEKAIQSNIGDVYVACGDKEILDTIFSYGYNGILTPADLPSGTDRVYHAMQTLDQDYDYIINLQGDLPLIAPNVLTKTLDALIKLDCDIATPIALIKPEEQEKRSNPNVVKAIITASQKALYFTRAKCPYGDGPMYEHIGIYAYKKQALELFVKYQPSNLEKLENLEQLRALENNMTIATAIVDNASIAVDTLADLEMVRNICAL